ncbi:MAG: hypothetical protein IJ532_08850 [Alphaproteobacteria bacterium]|nr:hypothetical protein [Alphaproteobacteria bacterium]
MTNQRYTAIVATLFDSAADATLDYAVTRHNIHKTVFLLTLIAFIGQLVIGAAYTGIECTFKALPYVALHGVLILLGYSFVCEQLAKHYGGRISNAKYWILYNEPIHDYNYGYKDKLPTTEEITGYIEKMSR